MCSCSIPSEVDFHIDKTFQQKYNVTKSVLGQGNPTSKAIHDVTNRKVEKISRLLCVAVGKVSPQILVWPKFIGCFAVYLTTDLGSEAFELPIPLW